MSDQVFADKFDTLLGRSTGVYALPNVYVEFDKKLQCPETTNAQLADIIQLDAGLTAFLLRIVNSAFYGFSRRIISISHAINIIGRSELATLVMGKYVVDLFSDIKIQPDILNAHWAASLQCAITAKTIAKHIGYKEYSPETLFVAGLIHDIGKLVIWNTYPKLGIKSREILSAAENLTIEKQTLGFDHSELGAYMVQTWHLPDILMSTTRYYASKEKAREDDPVAILYIAKILNTHKVFKTEDGFSAFFEKSLLEKFGLLEDALDEILKTSESLFVEMKSTLLG